MPSLRISGAYLDMLLEVSTRRGADIDWSNAAAGLPRDTSTPDRWIMLGWLAGTRFKQYESCKCQADLDGAIVLWREAVALCPQNYEDRSIVMGGLVESLWTRFEVQGNVEDLDEVIELRRAVLSLPNDHVDIAARTDQNLSCRPEDHSDRPSVLDGLAISLATRFGQNGNMDDLNEAVQLLREALSLRPHGHPERSASLHNLANILQTRFKQNGSTDDLNEAVQLHREALSLQPHGHPGRSSSLDSLASSLQTRFEQSGSTDDLNEAVELHREALSLCPHGHPNRSSSLNNLAGSLQTRFKQNGSTDDLNEAVELHREALSLFPHGHPNRSASLNNLASSLGTRFEQNGGSRKVMDVKKNPTAADKIRR